MGLKQGENKTNQLAQVPLTWEEEDRLIDEEARRQPALTREEEDRLIDDEARREDLPLGLGLRGSK